MFARLYELGDMRMNQLTGIKELLLFGIFLFSILIGLSGNNNLHVGDEKFFSNELTGLVSENGLNINGLNIHWVNSNIIHYLPWKYGEDGIIGKNLYHNIDIVIQQPTEGKIAMQWIVRPGSDAGDIILELDGRPGLTEQGKTIISLKGNILHTLRDLRAFQGTIEIPVKWIEIDRGKFSLEIGKYNKEEVLIIDPVASSLNYSTFLGGSKDDEGKAIVIGPSGDIYILGNTNSTDFPVTANAFDTSYNGGFKDAFICRLDAGLSVIKSATYLGGRDLDYGFDMVLDSIGNVYVAMRTSSDDMPIAGNTYKDTLTKPFEIYVARLSSDLSKLQYSSYVYPVIDEINYGQISLALDGIGNIYVGGSTKDSMIDIPEGAYDTLYSGSTDGILIKMDTAFSQIINATYLGDTLDDHILDIYFDGVNLYCTGKTTSPYYPVAGNPITDSLRGGSDIIVSAFNENLSSLVYSTFIGDVSFDAGTRIFGYDDEIIIGAITYSDSMPTGTGQVHRDSLGIGNGEVYLARLTKQLDQVLKGTYFGGTNVDNTIAATVDSGGFFYIAGETYSRDLPIKFDAFDTSFGGQTEGFVSKLNHELLLVPESSFIGGGTNDRITDLIVNNSAEVLMTGFTNSMDFPVTSDGLDTILNGPSDAVIVFSGLPATPVDPKLHQLSNNCYLFGDDLHIELKNPGYLGIDIYSLDGRLVMRKSIGYLVNGKYRESLSISNNGIYLVSVRMGNEMKTLKWSHWK